VREDDEGWAVVEQAADLAGERLGSALRTVYVLGSLAHGGFRPLVSDVDVLVVLDDPISPADVATIDHLVADVKGSGRPLADRLSLFWTSPAWLAGDGSLPTRLPPLDVVDLLDHGVLLRGDDCREGVTRPTTLDLVRGAAEFTVDVLARPERLAQITDPDVAVAGGARMASKVALFPVRFLYTARTGLMGENEAAAAHYLASTPPGPTSALVHAGLEWRTRWSPSLIDIYRGLLAAAPDLYREFVDGYAPELRSAGLAELADELEQWRGCLAV